MSAYHSRIVEEFRQHGGTLTSPQIAVVVGFGWRRDITEMRRLGYLIVEDPTDLWHLDLEELPKPEPVPDPDAGGAVDAGPSRTVCERDGSSPDIDTDPQVEGERPVLFEAERQSASPYDPSVEAA